MLISTDMLDRATRSGIYVLSTRRVSSPSCCAGGGAHFGIRGGNEIRAGNSLADVLQTRSIGNESGFHDASTVDHDALPARGRMRLSVDVSSRRYSRGFCAQKASNGLGVSELAWRHTQTISDARVCGQARRNRWSATAAREVLSKILL